jgi:hypothetical protein
MSDRLTNAPLDGTASTRKRKPARLTPLATVATLLSCAMTVLIIWLVLADDPNGGEPMAIIALPPASDLAASDEGLDFREGLGPEDAEGNLPAIDEQLVDMFEVAENIDVVDPLDAQFDALRDSDNASSSPLATAPLDAVSEAGTHGTLPRISTDGQTPAGAYARPLNPVQADPNSAKIAILITGLGLSANGTSTAINTLPGDITLAFAPYANNLQDWVHRARQNGHEVMLQVPMEPFDYPDNDPGPHTLLTSLTPAENVRRLEWLLARVTGYFGVTNYMGAKFTASPDALRTVLQQFHRRGLAYVEDGSSARSSSPLVAQQLGLSATTSDIIIDAVASTAAISAALQHLETLALESGVSVGVASGLPITVQRIVAWAKTLEEKGIYLVPVSATIALRENLT